MKIPAAFIVAASVAQVAIYLVAAPEHVVDDSWPPHARFHVLQAIGWVLAANLAVVALALGPLRRGDRWSIAVLAAVWPLLHGSYFASMAAIWEGRPPELSAHLIVAAPAALHLAGVAIAWLRSGRKVSG